MLPSPRQASLWKTLLREICRENGYIAALQDAFELQRAFDKVRQPLNGGLRREKVLTALSALSKVLSGRCRMELAFGSRLNAPMELLRQAEHHGLSPSMSG